MYFWGKNDAETLGETARLPFPQLAFVLCLWRSTLVPTVGVEPTNNHYVLSVAALPDLRTWALNKDRKDIIIPVRLPFRHLPH